MKSIDELTRKAEAGYAAGHHEITDLVRYIVGGEDLATRLVAGVVAERVIASHRSDKAAVGGLARDLGGQAAANADGKLPDLPSLSDTAAVIRDAVELPTRVGRWLTDGGTWVRIGYFVGGSVLIWIGVQMLVTPAALQAAGAVKGGYTKVKKLAK